MSSPDPASARALLVDGDHYLESTPDSVRWGYVPAVGAAPVLSMASGATVTIDTVSHEGILENQGRDPVAYFAGEGVPTDGVLADAIAIARDFTRTPRDFDVDGPHVVTGPIFVEGARPGDVLKVETLSAIPRVPYGVISSRHGKGSPARTADGGAPAGIVLDEVMPPVATDGRATGDPLRYGNVSVFTRVRNGRSGPEGVPSAGRGEVAFPLAPFMGIMGVAVRRDPGGVGADRAVRPRRRAGRGPASSCRRWWTARSGCTASSPRRTSDEGVSGSTPLPRPAG